MSEETKPVETVTPDNTNKAVSAPAEEKESNRTFTQSEHDKAVADAVKKAVSEFADHNDLKTKLETLEKEKKEREMAELSELEKRDIQLKELNEKLAALELANNQLKIDSLRSQVLSEMEYTGMPRAYRMQVEGNDEESIRESAKTVLEEYKADLEKQGKKPSFGVPDIKGGDIPLKNIPQNGRERVNAKLKELLSGRIN